MVETERRQYQEQDPEGLAEWEARGMVRTSVRNGANRQRDADLQQMEQDIEEMEARAVVVQWRAAPPAEEVVTAQAHLSTAVEQEAQYCSHLEWCPGHSQCPGHLHAYDEELDEEPWYVTDLRPSGDKSMTLGGQKTKLIIPRKL